MRIEFAFQCGEQWDRMCGGDRERHCDACDHTVTDLSTMTRAQATQFLNRTNGEACVSFRVDAEGETVFRPALPTSGVRGTVKAAMLSIPLLLAACEGGEPAEPSATPAQMDDTTTPVVDPDPGAIAKGDPKAVDEAEPACDDAADHPADQENVADEPKHRRLSGKPMPRQDDPFDVHNVPKHLD